MIRCAQRIQRLLSEQLDHLPQTELLQAMRYGLLSEGKRLRPYLVYAVGEFVGTPEPLQDAAAMAIECTHCCSLILDDLPAMDNDDVRRGVPSCHRLYGEATAILAANALQMLAFQLLLRSQQGAMAQTLAQVSGAEGLCLGQYLDLRPQASAVAYRTLYQYKTAELFRAALQFGRAGRAPHLEASLDTFAARFGCAYQFDNDYFDHEGGGRPGGSDQKQGKKMYPAWLGDEAAAMQQHFWAEALASVPIPALRPLVEKLRDRHA